MPRPSSFAKVEIETGERRERLERPEPDTPFRIAILGDFSGRANRGAIDAKLQGRKPVPIDRDNFEDVLRRFAPELRLPLGTPDSPSVAMKFLDLDDFHPDGIFERVRIFQALRETRDRLNDRSTYDQAAAEVRSWSEQPAPSSTPAQSTSPPDSSRLSAHELFEQTLSATETRSGGARPTRALDDFQAVLRDIVAPYVEPKPDPQKPDLIAQVDAAISGQMRALIHHPDFQALEAAWRAVFFLIRRLETGENLKIFLLDIAKSELAADLVATYELLVEPAGVPGAESWALLAGNYTFGPGDEDTTILARMAALARHAGAPFVAAASPSVLGCLSVAETPEPRRWRSDTENAKTWQALRNIPQANWLGLALPRFLVRLPYGRRTDAVEQFDFEEMAGPENHEEYLWGNPAFACAYLLGEAFLESGWDLRPGEMDRIEGLPAHVYRVNGESHLKPCAEVLLTENAAEAILDKGVMPILSIKGSDSVRLLQFLSVAEPAAPLSGRWP